EMTAPAGFHVTHDPPRGGRDYHPVRVDAVDSQPNIDDSPRETVIDVPLDPQPSRPVGLLELQPKWPLGVRDRSLPLPDNGPCNRRDRHCDQQQRLHPQFLSARIRGTDKGAFTALSSTAFFSKTIARIAVL